MCGITGWVNLEEELIREKRIIENMLTSLCKKEPAELGTYVSKNALLGHRDIKVENCHHIQQPLTKNLGNNNFTIVCIGELDNGDEIKIKLNKLGMGFKSASDIEIILTAYMTWGEECAKHIKGNYVFAIWDESRKMVFIARDPSGEKKLFYGIKSNSIIFASEVKALLAHPMLEPKTAHYLTGGIPNEVKELQPGYCLIYSRQGTRLKVV